MRDSNINVLRSDRGSYRAPLISPSIQTIAARKRCIRGVYIRISRGREEVIYEKASVPHSRSREVRRSRVRREREDSQRTRWDRSRFASYFTRSTRMLFSLSLSVCMYMYVRASFYREVRSYLSVP